MVSGINWKKTIIKTVKVGNVEANPSSYFLGGLVGQVSEGATVSDSWADVNVSDGDYIGGLVGRNYGRLSGEPPIAM
ncbi:hypothetical protein [Sporomusa aerivorans]|uniref:hypothetical protein n=1 Tax=Sporomusa aerivorans TaxID=204936 RepID=UPI00352A09AC